MNNFSDEQILESWSANVEAWVTAIRKEQIESRLLVTNKAIIDAIIRRKPASVLDAGCGEGWLVRELESRGIKTLGVDAVPALITAAKKEAVGRYKVLAYEEITQKQLKESFDVIVCNFSLLGNKSVTDLFEQVPSLLNIGGAFIVQTIHPVAAVGDGKYIDGWRRGSWAGFSDAFHKPAPWYFRTIESWKLLYLNNGMNLLEIVEPIHPQTHVAASIIFIGIKNA